MDKVLEEVAILQTTTAVDIASYINASVQWGFDNKKTQKLVYFSNAWSLAWTARPLTNEDFLAFVNGPVEFELYKTQRYGTVPAYSGQLNDAAKSIVDSVLAHYAPISTAALIGMSHEAPWREARGGLPALAHSQNPLRQSSIRDFYTDLAIEGHGPKRLAQVAHSADHEVSAIARAASVRWRDALDILATQ